MREPSQKEIKAFATLKNDPSWEVVREYINDELEIQMDSLLNANEGVQRLQGEISVLKTLNDNINNAEDILRELKQNSV